MRAVLDTNVVRSAIFFGGGDPKAIVRAAVSKRIEFVATKAVLAEYHEVAERLHEHYPSVSFRRPLAILESIVKLVRPATLGGAADHWRALHVRTCPDGLAGVAVGPDAESL